MQVNEITQVPTDKAVESFGISHRKEEYEKYLKSDTWAKLRDQRLELDKHTCRMCAGIAAHVHHIRYPQVFGTESMEDLTSLCSRCHKVFHEERKVTAKRKPIQERFEDFIKRNPEVWTLFVQFSEELWAAGQRKYGARSILERIRWHYAIKNSATDEFKINDNYISRFARKLMEEHPKFSGFFETRTLHAK